MSLDGKQIVLTGGSGGIGKLVADRLTAAGAEVTIVDKAAPSTKGLRYIAGDLGSLPGIAAVAAEVSRRSCDILINLAGIQFFGPLEQQEPGHVAASYTVNLIAPVLLTQAVLPGMKSRRSGQIVNVGSIFGSINFAHFATYSSSKAGLRGFSEALRRELKGSGIDVTYIAPRAVKTALNSANVVRFAQVTGMNMDSPETVAAKICAAITSRRKDVYFGFPESLFVRVNSLLPRLVDVALAGNDRQARQLFSQ